MKTLINKLTLLLLIIFILGASNVYAAGYYTSEIENLEFNMVVNENSTYDIHIIQDIDMFQYQHGIYYAIPRSGSYYREVNGKSVESRYYANITNIRVESGQPYSTDTDGDALVIQIGDPDRVVTGLQHYELSYTYDPGDDGFSEFDDVYQKFLTQYITSPIDHLKITVEMPKPFDASDVYFYSGDYDTTTNADGIVYQINGDTITAENTSTIYPGTIVSMRIVLPDGYFVGARTGNELLPLFYITVAIVLIIGIIFFILKGKGRKPLEPVTFYPPDGLDPTQVAFVLDNHASNESLVALLIYFADKGWLAIENISQNLKKGDYVLHKLQDIPLDRPIFERTIFQALFKKSDEPSIKSLTGKTYMGNAFISAQEQVKDWFSGNNKLFSSGAYLSKTIQILGMLIVSIVYGIVGSYLSIRSIDVLYVLILTVIAFFGPMLITLSNQKKKIVVGIVISLFCAFFSVVFVPSIMVIGLCYITNILLGILCHFSNRRTERGNKWLGECRAFKHFIKTAELDRLKLLVEENPEYYYDILPYAYAMGLTDKWAQNFEGIAMAPPTWYVDPYYTDFNMFRTLYFMNMFNRGIVRNINHINTAQLRNMGSGGFGGGGFGGGGFGGGAGGGIGTGTW